MKPGPRIAVVVPTYRRDLLLKKWIRRFRGQTYDNWALTVVHDGADAATRAMMEAMTAEDPRIRYLETPERGNDFGVTPRIFGVSRVAEERSADYVVFWDDDFFCYKTALGTIAGRILEADEPDLLLAPIVHHRVIKPTPGVTIPALGFEQLDMACLVARPDLAARFYPEVLAYLARDRNFYCQDYELFDRLRKVVPPPRMAAPGGRCIGIYNGMYRHEWLVAQFRWLKLPVNPRTFAWYRRLVDSQPKASEQPGA